jgi:hypothetical protein
MLPLRVTAALCAIAAALPSANASDYYAVGLVPNQARTDDLYLFRIDQTQHQLTPGRLLASNPDFVVADLERSVVVAGFPFSAPTHIEIVSTASPLTPRQVDLSYTPPTPLAGKGDPKDEQSQELPYAILEVEQPGAGPYLALALGRLWTADQVLAKTLTGVALNTADSPLQALPLSAISSTRATGVVGDRCLCNRLALARGNPLQLLVQPDTGLTGFPEPPGEPASAEFQWAVNNDEMLALLPAQESRNSLFHVYDKASRSWRAVRTPFPSLSMRGFGEWLAFLGSEPAPGTRALAPNVPPGAKQLTVVRGGFQAGNVDKRKEAAVSWRTTVEDVLEDSGHSHSGKLFLWNEKTGEQHELDTGEADSEVVLVTGDSVVYRVNDSLFEAGLSGGKVLPPTLLASGRQVTGVHWVFMTP